MVIHARSEMQLVQVRKLFQDYRAEVEALAAASGACP
jgi:hypothetical protein